MERVNKYTLTVHVIRNIILTLCKWVNLPLLLKDDLGYLVESKLGRI